MKEIKVNVWQLGYITFKDHLNWNKDKAQCRDMGFVVLDEKKDLWEEDVWNLLNWSCWTEDKPDNVKSPLTHCNSDIIINIEGTNNYLYAKSVGWGEANSLEDAKKKMKEDIDCSFWPFSEVKRTGGCVKREGDKVFQEINGKWTEVTW